MSHRLVVFSLFCSGVFFCGSRCGAEVKYRVVDLGATIANVGPVTPTSLNNRGHVVGYYSRLGESVDRPFFYDGTATADLIIAIPKGDAQIGVSSAKTAGLDEGTSSVFSTRVYAINDLDQMVGVILNSAFVLTADGTKLLLSGSNFTPRGINKRGDVVGTLDDPPQVRGIVLTSSGVTDIGNLGGSFTWPAAINSLAQIAGSASVEDFRPPHALFRDSFRTLDLGAGVASALNDSGQAAGYRDFPNKERHAVVFSGGAVIDIGTLGGPVSTALGLNNLGVVVGTSYSTPVGGVRAFVYRDGKMEDLNSLVDLSDGVVQSLFEAVAINDRGQILCTGNGRNLSTAFLLTPVAESNRPGRLVNCSLRAKGGTGDKTLIGGFVLAGDAERLLIRGVGPGIRAMGVRETMSDPLLRLFEGPRLKASNDSWDDPPQRALVLETAATVGAFRLDENSGDAAFMTSLAKGAYTFHVADRSGRDGVALAEIYLADQLPDTNSRVGVLNVSGRTFVGTGDDVAILGFVVAGDQPREVLIRAIGPTLGRFGVAGYLGDPQFSVIKDGRVVAMNDNWGDAVAGIQLKSASDATGAFSLPEESRDAAALVLLQPGAYSVVVSGKDDGTGVVLVELYLP